MGLSENELGWFLHATEQGTHTLGAYAWDFRSIYSGVKSGKTESRPSLGAGPLISKAAKNWTGFLLCMTWSLLQCCQPSHGI